MALSRQEVQAKYQSGARHYDFAIQLYRLIGIRQTFRSCAIKFLRLQPGDFVVELGCGTGLNFPLIIDQIGPKGRLAGVDLTPNMLARAQERVDRFGWKNVVLIQSDIETYGFPEGINKVLSVGVFGYLAEYDSVIKSVSGALVPGGRLVIMDGKLPEHWLSLWLIKFVFLLSWPFGVTLDYGNNHPWESVESYFEETAFEQMYGGGAYISSGTAPLFEA